MSFDRLAAVYSYMEYLVFGKDLERCRFRYLDALSDSRSILILGEGDGRFLNRLLRHNEHARVDCVDNSPAMVRKAQALISTSGDALNLRVKFHRISIDKFNFEPNYYDAVVTHFFLDCFSGDQLSRLISNIGTSANDSCRWLVSDFHYPNSGFTRIRAKIWIWFLYAFFYYAANLENRILVTAHPYIAQSGFQLMDRSHYSMGMLQSSLWQRLPDCGAVEDLGAQV
ncbi:MAG TPA: class I SAM-dependent methyltransferase [Verrucomicrobiales bacterium]|nr:class I SAM-dependent methyltransferase [Verrucomicrobiales bacterium]HIL69884.1 class I SAM-dependent methyltransferase [Verrucomicrobiota bacterium]